MYKVIEYKGDLYPEFQSQGFAAKFAFPFATEILKNCKRGFDIGCNNMQWCFPGATPIDPNLNGVTVNVKNSFFEHHDYHAMNLPKGVSPPDYIFSSHMLEHYNGSWVEVLEYWKSVLPSGGVLFLYLPHYSQKYWRSFNNRKHVHNLSPQLLRDYLMNGGWHDILVSDGPDLNNSFYAVAKKI